VHPFELYSGAVKDWDGVERLWRYVYDHELKVQPDEYAVLMSEKEGTALRDR
jgi:actin-related protein